MSTHKECKYCGKDHKWGKQHCAAYGKLCKKCNKQNHFAQMCRSSAKSGTKQAAVHMMRYESDSMYEDSSDDQRWSKQQVVTLTLTPRDDEINVLDGRRYGNKLCTTLTVDETPIRFQMDTSATCNVIRKQDIPHRRLNDLQQTTQTLTQYSGAEIRPLVKCILRVKNQKNAQTYDVQFVVVDNAATTSILGAQTSQAMSLIKVDYDNIQMIQETEQPQGRVTWRQTMLTKEVITQEYAEVFEGELGTLPGVTHLDIDPMIQPVKQPLRRLPIAMKDRLKAELQRLERLEIIQKEEASTDWISSLVVVKKQNGKLRVCIDPQPLNKALKRSQYQMPILDDILPELSKAKIFSVLDVKNGYWHIAVWDHASTGNFQRALDNAIHGLAGIYTIADDILVVGSGTTHDEARKDHDENLLRLLQRCRNQGIKLNKDKSYIATQKVAYMGHVLTSQGIKPDDDKIEAIVKMPPPQDVQGVRRLIGMTNYLLKFMPHLSDLLEPLRQLTKQHIQWEWTDVQETAFNDIKRTVTTTPVLRYFDPKDETTIQCDASQTGLGAVLMQSGQPVAYTSRTLTDTEQQYAQIEKELLAIVFGMEKFNTYTYGRIIKVETDHKPLETIHRKHCTQHRREYKQGKQMVLADTFSRAYLQHTPRDCERIEVFQVKHNLAKECEQIDMLQDVQVSQVRLADIRNATKTDTAMQQLKQTILQGWPDNKHTLPGSIAEFFNVRDELVIQDDIILRGNRVVVPRSCSPDMLQRIHTSHIGVNGCLRRARESLYWPGITAKVKNHVSRCHICRTYETRQTKEKLQAHEIPDRPRAKVGVDLFTFQGREYLLTTDYYSNYWETDRLLTTTSEEVVKKLKAHFA
ncbi:uncharacterized protein K02A2.6-like [Corticium candelabrum]|uniref:uncharacterized protein K02A2.6-like n=1 Tax=Corticium candelabrum TaxID=121492 RepID=UPI002E25D9A2|nr:uncharacterized protein K02A2.6-like [Corticium candelabrum]